MTGLMICFGVFIFVALAVLPFLDPYKNIEMGHPCDSCSVKVKNRANCTTCIYLFT
jgi:hypothetical protein